MSVFIAIMLKVATFAVVALFALGLGALIKWIQRMDR